MPEIGYQVQDLPGWGMFGGVAYETNTDLIWPNSTVVFDRMRREDAQVGSVLRAVTLPILRNSWALDPAGARPEIVNWVANDLGLPVKGEAFTPPLRRRGRFSWSEHLRLALLELPYGHSYFEQIYEPEADGGLAHIRKLAWRPPRTIETIEVARDGGLIGIRQYGVKRLIGVNRLVAYVNEREGGNWLGQSLLRTAYKNWLLKDRELRAQALTIERNGLGVPVYTGAELPDNMSAEERETWLKSEMAAGLAVASSFRAGESSGVSLPPSAKFTLQGVDGRLPDTERPIRYHDEQIARAVLAHFLNLGTETGSWALGSTFANFFTDSLNAVAQHIADTANQHVVEDLVDLNWGPDEPAPVITPAVIGEEQAATADSIKALIECGAITPDDDLEAYMRSRYRLPVRDADTSRTAPAVTTQEVA